MHAASLRRKICLLSVLLVARMSPAVHSPDEPRLIEIVAQGDNRFQVIGEKTPIIRATAGERLRLRITAHRGQEMARDGAVHSLVIRELRTQGWDLRLHEGTQVFSLSAPASSGE